MPATSTFERLLSAIYSGIEHPGDWIDALDRLAVATGSRAAGLFVVRPGGLSFETNAGMPAEFIEQYRLRAANDPRVTFLAARRPLNVVGDDLPSLQPAIHAAGVHHATREFDLEYTAGTRLNQSRRSTPVFYISRSRSQGPLPGESTHLMRRLAPHFARALRIHDELAAVGGATARRQQVLDEPSSDPGDLRTDPASALPPQLVRVLDLVADGLSNGEIAAALHLSINTVRNHIQRLFRLTGASRRTALVRAAVRRGWLRLA